MRGESTRIVISDLHLGCGDRFDIFEATGKTASFVAFVEGCAARPEAVELVINGDFVDFLQLKPWDTVSNREIAIEKAEKIAAANIELLSALGKFLAASKNSLRVLLGNHDIEIAFNDVWSRFSARILSAAPDGKLHRENARVSYNPIINGVHVAIEHGNKRDYWNEIRYAELFQDNEKSTSSYRHPPGTRLVYEIMNGFKDHLQFVDLLKPEMPAVPLLLLRLRPIPAAAAIPAATWKLLNAFVYGLASSLRRQASGPRLGVGAETATSEENAYDLLAAEYAAEFGNADRTEAATEIERYVEDPDPVETTAPNLGRRWTKVTDALKRTVLRRLGRSAAVGNRQWFQADHPDLLDVGWAASEFVGKVQIVIFGHTHGALKHERSDGAVYLNSGTWANLIEMPSDPSAFSIWLTSIADNSFVRTSFPTFIVLEPIATGVRASLHHWTGTAAEELWSKSISPSK